jgi:hypothetical protein
VVEARRKGELVMTNAMIDGVRVDVVIDTGSDQRGQPRLATRLGPSHP